MSGLLCAALGLLRVSSYEGVIRLERETESQFFGPNLGYVLELYEQLQGRPRLRRRADAGVLRVLEPAAGGEHLGQRRGQVAPEVDVEKAVGASKHVRHIRDFGHRAARLDPLGQRAARGPDARPDLLPDHRRGPGDAARAHHRRPIAERASTAREAVDELREIYCNTTGYDFGHVHDPEERFWLRESVESGRFAKRMEGEDAKRLLLSADQGGRLREVPAQDLPRPEAVLRRGQRHGRAHAEQAHPFRRRRGHAGDHSRHGPPRPPERAGARHGQALLQDLRRVPAAGEGRAVLGGREPRRRMGRGREVPPRHPGLPAWRRGGRRGGLHQPGAEPEPPRARQPGGRGDGPRRPGGARRGRAAAPGRGGVVCPSSPRGRGVPRRGGRGRDA